MWRARYDAAIKDATVLNEATAHMKYVTLWKDTALNHATALMKYVCVCTCVYMYTNMEWIYI